MIPCFLNEDGVSCAESARMKWFVRRHICSLTTRHNGHENLISCVLEDEEERERDDENDWLLGI